MKTMMQMRTTVGDNAIGDRNGNRNGDDNAITVFGSAAVEG